MEEVLAARGSGRGLSKAWELPGDRSNDYSLILHSALAGNGVALGWDHIVGELMRTLEELGVTDDTLVMFSSDNGPETPTVWHMRKTHNHDGSHPWRGVKREVWEGGHRVPFIVRYPRLVRAPRRTTCTALNLDIAPTIMELAGLEIPGIEDDGSAGWTDETLVMLVGDVGDKNIKVE